MRARSAARPLLVCATTLLGWWGAGSCTDPKTSSPAGIVRVADGTTPLVTGPEAAGRVGDFVFDNGAVRFVVQSPESSTGWGLYGGALMDAASVGAEGASVDLLEELFVQCDLRGFRPISAEIVAPGDASTPGVLRLVGADAGIPFLDAILPRDPLQITITVDFSLAPTGRTLDIEVSAKDERKQGSRELACGVVLLPGDAHRLFVPGRGFTDDVGGKQPYLAAESEAGGASYVLHREGEPLNVLLSGLPFLPIATDPKPFLANATLREKYRLTMGDGPGVERALLAAGLQTTEGGTKRPVQLKLTGPEAVALSQASLRFEAAALPEGRRVVTAAMPNTDLVAQVDLPAGQYEVVATLKGGSEEVQRFSLEVLAGEGAQTVEHTVTGLGRIRVRTQELGLGGEAMGPSPARVGVVLGAGSPVDDSRVYEAYAEADHTLVLPEGTYTVIVSRGPEHELHVQTVQVVAGTTVDVMAEVRRVVDRSGWVSADLHVHGTRSTDSEVPRIQRVLGAAAEGLDVLVATDHDAVTDYAPQVQTLGLQDRLRTASGTEMSMLYGHINGFPVAATQPADHWRPAWFVYGQDGRFERALEPVEVVQALRAEGAEVVQINHPRASQSLFNYIDLDPATGLSDKTWPEPDAMELLNGKRLGEYPQVLADFHGLLLSGRRITGTGTSDIHGDLGVGYARTYVRAGGGASLAQLDLAEVWAGLKAGRVLAASGAFVELTARQGQAVGEVGDTMQVTGPLALEVRVQAPSWMQPSHIKIYNRRDVLWERDLTPADADPTKPALRFSGTITATVTQDTYFMVEVTGTRGRPWIDDELSVTNPIFVDPEGDGLNF